MSNNILTSPPHWCRYAIPSVRGWCDPKTGELLIAVKGIKFDQVKVMELGDKPEIPAILKMPVKVEADLEKANDEVDDVAEKIAEVKAVVEVVKETKEKETTKTTTKKRGRKKKTEEK